MSIHLPFGAVLGIAIAAAGILVSAGLIWVDYRYQRDRHEEHNR